MNVSDHVERAKEQARSGGVFARAVESAQSVVNDQAYVPGGIPLRHVVIFASILGAALLFAAARIYGVPVGTGVFSQQIATENALTAHSSLAGIGGFLGTFIASTRLASIEGDTVTLSSLAAPIAVTFIGNVVAGFMFPSGGSSSLI